MAGPCAAECTHSLTRTHSLTHPPNVCRSGTLSTAQRAFVASHFVGSQKLFVPETEALRKLNPGFIMLHYHLAIWQTASNHPLVINGTSWGNDYPLVAKHDSWFWRNTSGGRVVSTSDGK